MKTKTFLSLVFTLNFCLLHSQVPQGFNYQAIARDGSGNPITNTSMPVRLTIQTDSAGTIVIWQELFSSVTTNSFGLFTLVMGRGARQAGTAATFDAIDWSVTPKFIKTEVNNGGWKDMGTTRFWSVPYSIRAKDTETKQTLSLAGANLSISGGNTVNLSTGTNQWQTDGTNLYRTAGNIGIGTSTPGNKLVVVGDANINTNYFTQGGIEFGLTGSGNRFSGIDFHGDDTYTDYALRILRYNTGPNAMSGIVHRGTGEFQIGTQDAGFLTLFTNSTERLRVTASGNVGINTASPNSLLNPYLTIGDGLNNSAEIMDLTIKPTGNTDYLRFYGIRKAAGTDWSNVALRIQQRVDATDMGYIEFNPSTYGYDLAFGTANIERLRITSGGNIGIGTTTPTSKLVINPSTSWDDDTPLFEVKNKDGYTIFAVYNKGVRILVERNDAKGTKGGFAIGGFDPTKGPGTFDLASISLDSVRFNINNAASKGSTKGGFAIGSFDNSKGPINQDFMYITAQASGSGQYNTFVGYKAGYSTTTGNKNVVVGYNAGMNLKTGFNNVFIGNLSGSMNNSGTDNVCIGTNSGKGGTISFCTFIGSGSGVNNSASNNTFIGAWTGSTNTSGAGNTFVGNFSGFLNSTGNNNIYLGDEAGEGNTGSGNIFIGYHAGLNTVADNKLIIANSETTTPLIGGDFSASTLQISGYMAINAVPTSAYGLVTGGGSSSSYSIFAYKGGYTTGSWVSGSDERLKKDICPMENVIGKLNNINPVRFHWRVSEFRARELTSDSQIGMIAQEVENEFPELVSKDKDGYLGIAYDKFTAVLLAAVKEQQQQIESTRKENQQLRSELDELKTLVNTLVTNQTGQENK